MDRRDCEGLHQSVGLQVAPASCASGPSRLLGPGLRCHYIELLPEFLLRPEWVNAAEVLALEEAEPVFVPLPVSGEDSTWLHIRRRIWFDPH